MYPLQLRVEVNEVSDSPYFSPGKLWQSEDGHKASYLQFMQTSALLHSFLTTYLLTLLSFSFVERIPVFVDVAVREFVFCAILHQPDLVPLMSESFSREWQVPDLIRKKSPPSCGP